MKLVLAPMATLSHEALRVLIHRYGDPDEYFSEMINASSFMANGRFEKWYVRTSPRPERMVWQLTGTDSATMAAAAGKLASLDGIGVDLNMGCSAPEIVRGGAGIAWMLKPIGETTLLVRGVRRALDAARSGSPGSSRLSVKLRLGIDEEYPRLLAFCRMLVEEGVETITLHPRIKSDKYGRPARRLFVGRLSGDLGIPVYGNGDIDSARDALAYPASYPCAGLMIGRAAVRQPWLFGRIRARLDSLSTPVSAETLIDHLEVADFFLTQLVLCQPEEFWLSRLHRFFFYYCENFSFAHHIKMRIQNAQSPDVVRALLEEYFTQVPEDRYLRLPGIGP